MKKTLMITMVLLVALMSAPALSGTISGAGGRLSTLKDNPWFLHNKDTVRYCVLIDEVNYDAHPSNISSHISYALRYYKRLFSHWHENNRSLGRNEPFKLADASFQWTDDCSDDVDIEFRFGYVDNTFLEIIPDPENYAGAAILTSYDERTLSGKGMIYIGANRGPYAMRSNVVDIDSTPWQTCNGLNVEYMLIHELGHVFGLKHDTFTIMDENFANSVIDATRNRLFREQHSRCTIERGMLMGQGSEFASGDASPRSFVTLRENPSVAAGRVALTIRTIRGGKVFLEGVGGDTSVGDTYLESSQIQFPSPGIRIVLPPGQVVFPGVHGSIDGYRVPKARNWSGYFLGIQVYSSGGNLIGFSNGVPIEVRREEGE